MTLLFDSSDRALLAEVQRVRACQPENLATRLHPQLHPQGIQELSAHRAVRVAGAVATLLESLSRAQAGTRLQALRVLREEALSGDNPALRYNTGRVLLQLMKELVRFAGNELRQLELARDFRNALHGKPRQIRALLDRYHLLQMPEDSIPATFDDHVHDASTKGRKTPSHLLLDAWIKGISSLTIVYYNYLPPEAVCELLEAAEILQIEAKPGVEFPALFHGTLLNVLWVPNSLHTSHALYSLLSIPAVAELMRLGHEVSSLRRRQLLHLLTILNAEMLPQIEARFGITLPRLESEPLEELVADGQPSLLHLTEYVLSLLRPILKQKVQTLLKLAQEEPHAHTRNVNLATIRELGSAWDSFDADQLKHEYIKPFADRYALRDSLPPEQEQLPLLLQEDIGALTERLRACNGKIFLSSTHLKAWDVPEILTLCQGALSGLEIYNLKDAVNCKNYDTKRINQLRLTINAADITGLKSLLTDLHHDLAAANPSFCGERLEGLRQTRRNIGSLLNNYEGRPLEAMIGSDSAGRSKRLYGMGLAVLPTLSPAARRRIASGRDPGRLLLPVRCRYSLHRLIPSAPNTAADGGDCGSTFWQRVANILRRITLLSIGNQPGEKRTWLIEDRAAVLVDPGNLITLGGTGTIQNNEDVAKAHVYTASALPSPWRICGLLWRWRNLNSGLRNLTKAFAGFIPAFLTFYLTRDWWPLAWGGALLWFSITGMRNVVQAVLGGGGLRRSHLLRWRSLLDGSRIADSLFYTGLSVPLLDFFVRTLLLQYLCHYDAANHPFATFTVMSLCNGLYISGHNYYRGLPRAAIIGNLFRSLLAIPLATGLNTAAAETLVLLTTSPAAMALLLNSSAITAKLASDIVACLIEGLAERSKNLQRRREEWRTVLRSFFISVEKIELAFPDEDGREILADSKNLWPRLCERNEEQAALGLYAAALDMQYFWYCQPQARLAFAEKISLLTPLQRQELQSGIELLRQEETVTRLLKEGFAGEQYQTALRFYQENWQRFLHALNKLCPAQPTKVSAD